MAKEKFYRHGDLLIKRIDALPADGLKQAGMVLAEGETTGHKHRLVGQQVQVFDDAQGQKFLRLSQSAQPVHEEHKPITIEEGTYVIVHEREYNPFNEAIREVLD